MKQVLVFPNIKNPIHAWVGRKDEGPDIEDSALEQAKLLAQLDFLHGHGVALMPDVHAGIGSTVGSVIATRKAIIPAAVGVDIGCGMCAVRTSLKAADLPDSLKDLRHSIERGIPLGPGAAHANAQWDKTSPNLSLFERMMINVPKKVSTKNAGRQLGTLGGGNHFVELCLDEDQRVWVMLHSGSRGIGNQIGTYSIKAAQEKMKQYMVQLPHRDLAYVSAGTPEFVEYWNAVKWAQDYAMENRRLMMSSTLDSIVHAIKKPFDLNIEVINCHHNYVDIENHYGENVYVTRKGAIRARLGDFGIIPGSMGTRSYIVKGLGNPDSYHSCSHGAGRRMSRTAARNTHTVDDLVRQTEGVECRKDSSVLDEIPSAYKDIDRVMENQRDLVEVVHTLKAVLCIKGN